MCQQINARVAVVGIDIGKKVLPRRLDLRLLDERIAVVSETATNADMMNPNDPSFGTFFQELRRLGYVAGLCSAFDPTDLLKPPSLMFRLRAAAGSTFKRLSVERNCVRQA